MDAKWQDNAVCYADGKQYKANGNKENVPTSLMCMEEFAGGGRHYATNEMAVKAFDFQLNTIKQGDYIEVSELDTEQKYNDAVEVFGLFGFTLCGDGNDFEWLKSSTTYKIGKIAATESKLMGVRAEFSSFECERKITFNQLMAIGELRRLELEKSAPKIAPDLASKQGVKMQKNKPVVAQVMIDLTERMEIGIKTYGEALRANNGRDALQDAYEEALDLACYLKQAMIERDNANTN